MANPIVLTGFANPDPNAAPLNITELVQLLNQLVTSVITGSYMPYVVSHDVPAAEDRDKIWFALDPSGVALGIFRFWNGNWRRVYNGMLGQIVIYNGNPNTDFDSTGLGKLGLWYDGWALCNGQNGTPDLTDQFIIGAHMNGLQPGGDGKPMWSATDGFLTFVDGVTNQNSGGTAHGQIQLTAANTYRPARPAVTAWLWTASGNAPASNGDLYGLENATTISQVLPGGAADPGNPTPPAINALPPFIAMGFVMFVGYQP